MTALPEYIRTDEFTDTQRIVSVREVGSHLCGVANQQSDTDIICLYANQPITHIYPNEQQTIQNKRHDVDINYISLLKFMEDLSNFVPNMIEFLQSDRKQFERTPMLWTTYTNMYATTSAVNDFIKSTKAGETQCIIGIYNPKTQP